ncbi:MAG: hypothetical protein WA722_11925, partial [Candidatus Sulfotelmatobacter sp.]
MMQTSIEQILASYDDHAPLSQASTIPAAWYVDPRTADRFGLRTSPTTRSVTSRKPEPFHSYRAI